MKALFGPAGNSDSFYKQGYKRTVQAPEYLSKMGLSAYEYQTGQGLKAGEDTLKAIGAAAKENNISVSLHAPYFISLSSIEKQKRINSINYIKASAEAALALGANVMVVHTGSAAKITRELAMEYARETLILADEMLREEEFTVKLGLETMGKQNQLGTLSEVIELCKISDRFVPVVDFGHINAREGGILTTVDHFKEIFEEISVQLGGEYAQNLHCHFSKIEYTAMGEKKHLTFEDEIYGPSPELLMDAVVALGVTPTLICESDGTMAEDALELKRLYEERQR